MALIYSKDGKISFALSFVSGFVDAAGFISLFALFTAHVTGNLVLAGAALFDDSDAGSLASKLIMLPVFILAVMITTYLIDHRRTSLRDLMLIESLLIIGFSIIGGILFNQNETKSHQMVSITASFAVMGMAIQNTYMRKILNHYTANTVMTGNLTQFSISLFDLLFYFFDKNGSSTKDALQSSLSSFKNSGIALFGFLAGCFFGAFFVTEIGLYCCLLPAIILLWVRSFL